MTRLSCLLVFLATLLVCHPAIGQETDFSKPSSTRTTSEKLPNGLYLVQRWTIDHDDLFPLFDGEVDIRYDESKFLELKDDQPEPVKYIALAQNEFIPFKLAGDPDVKVRQDGRKLVGLTFSSEMSDRMKTFSRQYLGRQIATVIDGQIITLHKIRSVIEGGKLQISRCTDHGCELILSQLSKDNTITPASQPVSSP
jgi:hypothetical protein